MSTKIDDAGHNKWVFYVVGCKINLNGKAATFTSPGYPYPYSNNAQCDFEFTQSGTDDGFSCNINNLDLARGDELIVSNFAK